MKIVGLIVTAGLSSRMNDFKPLMEINDKPLILNTIDSLRQSEIDDIFIVVGYKGKEIEEKLKLEKVNIIYNYEYNSSFMYDSFRIGLNEIINKYKNKCDAIAFTPGDIGFVSKYTVDLLIDRMILGDKKIVYPIYDGVRGHPPIISSECFDFLLDYDGENGLKGGLDYFDKDSIEVSTPDKFILFDTDTKEDFNKVKNYILNRNLLMEEECISLLNYCNLPIKVINHSIKVKEIALDLSEEINKYGNKTSISINNGFLEVSCLLHDIKRNEKNHDLQGSKFLSDLGYKEISKIIRTHMNLPIDMINKINENTLLYLSDKLVIEDKYVGLEKKFKEKFRIYKKNIKVFDEIMRKYNAALIIKSNITSIIGIKRYEKLEEKWRENINDIFE